MNDEETVDSGGNELERVRELILAAHVDVAPELIAGTTVNELIDSIEPARAVFQSVIARMAPPLPLVPPLVPAGSAAAVVDPGNLPAHELIRRGLRTARK